MNTPAYFAVDNIGLLRPEPSPTVTLRRNVLDLNGPLDVTLSSSDQTAAVLPPTATIPAGQASVTVPLEVIDDALVDGDQPVILGVRANSYVSSSVGVTIVDDDIAILSLSVDTPTLGESGGGGRMVVHRNVADTQLSLDIALSADSSGQLSLPSTVTIPAGQRAAEFSFTVNDNAIFDGDRTVTITASADGYASSSASLGIADDDLAGLVVIQSDGSTEIDESAGQDSFQVSLFSQPLSEVFVNIVVTSDDLSVDIARLSFTPDHWSDPQAVTVRGIPDLLIEQDEIVALTLVVDRVASDSSYVPAADTQLEVIVRDHQPITLRVGEDDTSVFVVDQDLGIRIASGTYADGIEVIANDLAQTIHIDPLPLVSGAVQVDASGGDDVVVVHGLRFSTLFGGDGYDRLVLNLNAAVELVEFLDGRVAGFEEIVLASETGAELSIDGQQLGSIVSNDATLLVRLAQDQRWRFIGEGSTEDPIMIGNEFAQVIRFGDNRLHVISPSPWQNTLSRWDVNRSGDVTALDALVVVNQLARISGSTLPPLTSIDQFSGSYFDVSGDGQITAVDALRVINELGRRQLGTEGERIDLAVLPDARKSDTTIENRIASDMDSSIVPPIGQRSDKVVMIAAASDEAIRQLYTTEPGADGITRGQERITLNRRNDLRCLTLDPVDSNGLRLR